jgi:hypothetical protein
VCCTEIDSYATTILNFLLVEEKSLFDKSSNIEHDPKELLSIIALGPMTVFF